MYKASEILVSETFHNAANYTREYTLDCIKRQKPVALCNVNILFLNSSNDDVIICIEYTADHITVRQLSFDQHCNRRDTMATFKCKMCGGALEVNE